MAIKVRMLGTVNEASRSLTFTRSGVPRFSFGISVGVIRAKRYLVTVYGTMAKFADFYLRTGQRIRVEGAYLRRCPLFEGLVRADTIRHVGRSVPPFSGTVVRFVPATPRVPESPTAMRPIPREDAGSDSSQQSTTAVDDAIAAVS